MELRAGKTLTQTQKLEVLRTFTNRYTGQHRPRWTYRMQLTPSGNTTFVDATMPNGKAYQPTHKTDQDWIEDHAFYFTKAGRLSRRHTFCMPACMAD